VKTGQEEVIKITINHILDNNASFQTLSMPPITAICQKFYWVILSDLPLSAEFWGNSSSFHNIGFMCAGFTPRLSTI